MTGSEAFETFFATERLRLFRALIVVTRNTSEAEEVMQEAFIKVWERWTRVRSLDDPVGYLYRTALNEALQRRRRTLRRARHILPFGGSGEDPIERVDARDYLKGALLELPMRQRAALIVTEVLGYDSVAAGKIMGIQAGTVRRLVSQAKQQLRRRARDQEEERDD